MSSINTVTLVGRVGKDTDIRYTPDGKAVATLSLATSEKWKDKSGQTQESTDWHRITLFGRLAEIAGQYVKRGALIGVTGSIKYGKYTDKNGVERYTVEIRANSLNMLGGGNNDQSNSDQRPQNNYGGGRPQQGFNQQNRATDNFDASTADFDSFSEDVPF